VCVCVLGLSEEGREGGGLYGRKTTLQTFFALLAHTRGEMVPMKNKNEKKKKLYSLVCIRSVVQ